MNLQTDYLDSPIFVGGSGSAGTTLLAAMLNRHPSVFCGGELALFNKSRFFGDFATVKRKLAKWLQHGLPTNGYYLYPTVVPHVIRDQFPTDVLREIASESSSTRQFIDLLQRYCLQQTGKQVFAEKTPSNAYCFHELASLYPNCLLIHPIRDGRDVVCSLRKRGFDIFRATSLWLYNTACAIGCRSLPNYFEYKYADLVRDSPSVIKQICERVSIPFDDSVLNPAKGEQAPGTAAAWNNDPSGQISQRSVGRYATDLSDDDYSVFCSVQLTTAGTRRARTRQFTALELLQHLGYAAEKPRSRPSLVRAKALELKDALRRNALSIRGGWGPRRSLTKISL